MRALAYLILFIVVAGLTHILGLFALPRLTQADAFAWLGKDAPLHQMAAVEHQRLLSSTHIDPNFALAVCRYDLSGGPLRIKVPLSNAFISLSFANFGRGYFASISDRAATGGSLDVVLATPAQISKIAALDEEDQVVEEIRISAPQPRGLAVISAFVDYPSRRAEAEALLQKALCEQEGLPE